MRLLGFLTAGIFAIGCTAPSASSDGAIETSQDNNLIAGEVALADAFPSAMGVVNNCTVSRIGENLILTASHCVRTAQGAIRPNFAPGQRFQIRQRGTTPGVITLDVVKTTLHPRTAYVCQTEGCGNAVTENRRDFPDVAVIEFSGALDGVPVASVEVEPSPIGTEVSLVGYGCKTDVWSGDSDGQLRTGDTKLVGATASVHPGGIVEAQVALIDGIHAVTPGPQFPTEPGPGLCPGDSGGPLYKKGTDRVIGTAANYTFNGSRVPTTNWHSRIDGAVKWGIAAWLEQMGAKLSRPCTPELCQPVRDR